VDIEGGAAKVSLDQPLIKHEFLKKDSSSEQAK
jgi:hypothetical protein